MAMFSYDIQSMDDLYMHQLRDIYYAENQILKALPKMIEKTSEGALRDGLQSHLRETEGQVGRLDQVFSLLGEEPSGSTCPAIDGIISEAQDIMSEVEDATVLDAAIAASAQAVEHYEITRYGTLVAWSQELGRTDCAELLKQTLEEEKAADAKLSRVAEERVNRMAA